MTHPGYVAFLTYDEVWQSRWSLSLLIFRWKLGYIGTSTNLGAMSFASPAPGIKLLTPFPASGVHCILCKVHQVYVQHVPGNMYQVNQVHQDHINTVTKLRAVPDNYWQLCFSKPTFSGLVSGPLVMWRGMATSCKQFLRWLHSMEWILKLNGLSDFLDCFRTSPCAKPCWMAIGKDCKFLYPNYCVPRLSLYIYFDKFFSQLPLPWWKKHQPRPFLGRPGFHIFQYSTLYSHLICNVCENNLFIQATPEDHVKVTQEQYELYCEMGSTFQVWERKINLMIVDNYVKRGNELYSNLQFKALNTKTAKNLNSLIHTF